MVHKCNNFAFGSNGKIKIKNRDFFVQEFTKNQLFKISIALVNCKQNFKQRKIYFKFCFNSMTGSIQKSLNIIRHKKCHKILFTSKTLSHLLQVF